MQHAEYRLESFLKERDAEMARLKVFHPQYKANPQNPVLCNRITQCVCKIRALNGRIAKLGIRYNIVQVWGKYIVPPNRKGGLSYAKEFEIFYTDISEFDAQMLVELRFKRYGLAEIHTKTISVGKLEKKVI